MTIKVTYEFDTYMDYVIAGGSFFRPAFENLSKRAKDKLNEIFANKNINAQGPYNPNKLWGKLIVKWANKKCLVDNLKLLKLSEYVAMDEKYLIEDYIQNNKDKIERLINDFGYTLLDYDNYHWIMLPNKI